MRRRSKYNAKATLVDGIRFASKKEAKRYGELRLLEKAGKIFHLALQPRYPCVVGGILVCTYVADFNYYDASYTGLVVEDVKGVRTPLYRLKKKLVEAIYGITITEV